MSSDLENLIKGIGNTVRTIQLVINSADRENYASTSSSDFRINLQNPVNSKIIAYGLESCTITKTSYNISAGKNTFQLQDSVNTKLFNIPPGNYSSSTFISTLTAVLIGGSPDNYVVSKNPSTNKLTITSSYAFSTLNPNSNNYPLLGMMGFLPNAAYTASGGLISAPFIFDISGVKNLYIKVLQLTEYMRDTKNLSSNFKIDYGCEFGSVLYFSNKSKYLQFYTTAQNHLQQVDHFDIQLVDENNNIIDLNGSNWSFVLRFITKDTY